MNAKLLKEIDWRMKVFDSLSFPTLIMTPDKIIVHGNQVFFDKFKTNLEEIVGKTCYEVFYNSPQCPNTQCPLPKVIAERKGQNMLHSVITESRRKRWEDRVFSPILGDDGEVAYILESVRDVTRVKNLEIALKETEAFLEKIITASPIAIVVADRYGNVLLMNLAAMELFGYSSWETATNISATDLYPEGIGAEIKERLKDEEFGGMGKLRNMNTTILRSDGEEIPVEITASIIYEDEEEIAVVGLYSDLREKQAVEKKLKDAQARMAQSEKMASIGRLAAGVAHEINNPLTGILFYAEMKQAELAADDPERGEVESVIDDVNRCRDIVKNLLAYSRQSNSKKEIIQLNEIVDQSLALIREPKALMNIEIVKEIYADKMMVHVDRNQICRVVINLVLNAVAAMEGSGRLVFRTYRDARRQKAVLEIEDNGCGISKEHLPHIFDPFFTTKQLGEGTGLGLSTVYGLIQENKGAIEVKQTSEKGTTFRVELPLLQSIESAGQEP
jgi:two-component system NtrC family sensor kinase